MQQDKHRRLVAGVESDWIPDGAREACDGVLRNQVYGGLKGRRGGLPHLRIALWPEQVCSRTRTAGRHAVFNGRHRGKHHCEV